MHADGVIAWGRSAKSVACSVSRSITLLQMGIVRFSEA